MRIVRHAPRPATAGLLAATVVLGLVTGGLARGQEDAPAGNEPEPLDAIPTDVEIPNDIDLLRAPPFDLLTLLDGVTIRVDPVSPRPLPSMEELEADRTKNSRVERIGGIMVGRAPEVKQDPRDEAIIVHTLDGEPRDYYLKYVSIKKSEYYEDILLADAIRRARTGDFDRAFELTLIVEARDPDWPGLHATADRLLFMEGQWAMDRNDVDNGLRLLGRPLRESARLPGARRPAGQGLRRPGRRGDQRGGLRARPAGPRRAQATDPRQHAGRPPGGALHPRGPADRPDGRRRRGPRPRRSPGRRAAGLAARRGTGVAIRRGVPGGPGPRGRRPRRAPPARPVRRVPGRRAGGRPPLSPPAGRRQRGGRRGRPPGPGRRRAPDHRHRPAARDPPEAEPPMERRLADDRLGRRGAGALGSGPAELAGLRRPLGEPARPGRTAREPRGRGLPEPGPARAGRLADPARRAGPRGPRRPGLDPRRPPADRQRPVRAGRRDRWARRGPATSPPTRPATANGRRSAGSTSAGSTFRRTPSPSCSGATWRWSTTCRRTWSSGSPRTRASGSAAIGPRRCTGSPSTAGTRS